jgi:hypothetical protein
MFMGGPGIGTGDMDRPVNMPRRSINRVEPQDRLAAIDDIMSGPLRYYDAIIGLYRVSRPVEHIPHAQKRPGSARF